VKKQLAALSKGIKTLSGQAQVPAPTIFLGNDPTFSKTRTLRKMMKSFFR